MHCLENLSEFLTHLSDLADAQTLPRFRNLTDVDNKQDAGFDPVTEADRAAEQAIRSAIMERYPGHGIEGEEFGFHQPEARYHWIVDPVDGTRAFISGIPVWGTLIGLCEHRNPIAGIMSQPFTGERFIASDGTSRYLRGGKERQLSASGNRILEQSILMTTAPELFDAAEHEKFKSLALGTKMVRYGTDCYAYCMLAAGQIDLVMESGLSFYDIAALVPLIENAGGMVSDWDGNRINDGGQVLASANRHLHDAALKHIHR